VNVLGLIFAQVAAAPESSLMPFIVIAFSSVNTLLICLILYILSGLNDRIGRMEALHLKG